MKRVVGGSVFLAVLTVGVAASAQSPMTPSRPNPPTADSSSWVEPPPGAKPPTISGPAAIPTAKPDQQASATEQRPARQSSHTDRASSNSTAARLNRRELNRIRSGGSLYYRGYWPWSGY